jgi:hypothetical protein
MIRRSQSSRTVPVPRRRQGRICTCQGRSCNASSSLWRHSSKSSRASSFSTVIIQVRRSPPRCSSNTTGPRWGSLVKTTTSQYLSPPVPPPLSSSCTDRKKGGSRPGRWSQPMQCKLHMPACRICKPVILASKTCNSGVSSGLSPWTRASKRGFRVCFAECAAPSPSTSRSEESCPRSTVEK